MSHSPPVVVVQLRPRPRYGWAPYVGMFLVGWVISLGIGLLTFGLI